MLRILITALCAYLSMYFYQQGDAWIYDGIGIHPAIAFTMATICVFIIAGLAFFANDINDAIKVGDTVIIKSGNE